MPLGATLLLLTTLLLLVAVRVETTEVVEAEQADTVLVHHLL
jgi:hypothetical protein